MDVLFLDIDGVLNSEEYYMSLSQEHMRNMPIDRNCVGRLKKIIDETSAHIVLTSSWRGGWDKEPAKLMEEGRILNAVFGEFGLTIYDKTPVSHRGRRPEEIRLWMDSCGQKIHRYVIIDDYDFGWKENRMYRHWIATDFNHGGLLDAHVRETISLFHKSAFYFMMERFTPSS